jgi:hypothetical protein
MLIVLPYYSGDQALAQKLVDWIYELEPDFAFGFITVRDSLAEPIKFPLAAKPGLKREILYPNDGINQWPYSPNRMLNRVVKDIELAPQPEPFLWLEPDCVVWKAGWALALKEEYWQKAVPSKKVFLGDRVQVQGIALHMSGVAVYPGNMTLWAGEATIAIELAWDMQGAHQIVPHAYWTKLIVHAWDSATAKGTEPRRYNNLGEVENLRGQHPGMVLFHADKSGTIIDLLREERLLVVSGGVDARSERETPRGSEQPTVVVQRTFDIFIKAYPPDYPWLQLCLQSIHDHVKGFNKIIVVAPDDKAPVGSKEELLVKPEYDKSEKEPDKDGYLGQQIAKLYADMYSQADYIMHVDCDVLFTRPTTLMDFVDSSQGAIRVKWLYTPYEKVDSAKCWQPITGKFLKRRVDFEFMRRAPQMIPRWLYPKLREHCYLTQEVSLSDYIWQQPRREFSEFNALGAYAYYYHHTEFAWQNTLEGELPVSQARQFRSWDGLDVNREEINRILPSSPVDAQECGELPRGGKERPPHDVVSPTSLKQWQSRESKEKDSTRRKRGRPAKYKMSAETRRKLRAAQRVYWTPERREEARQRALQKRRAPV